MLENHPFPQEGLDALAASEPVLARELAAVSRSRNLTLLRGIMDRAHRSPSLPALEAAWTLLADAHANDRTAIEPVLAQPLTGFWAARILRRMHGSAEGADTPLWADLGRFPLMSVAAALRAGLDFSVQVPMWQGTVMVPTLGMATLPDEPGWSHARIELVAGRVSVHGSGSTVELPANLGQDTAFWQASRRVDVGGWGWRLDDLEPLRAFGELRPVRRVPATEIMRWEDLLGATRRMLTEHHPRIANDLTTGISTLVPYSTTGDDHAYSATSKDAFGCIGLSRPRDVVGLAEVLVHEFAHSKLDVLLTHVDLVVPGPDSDTPQLYAPWRDDPRPVGGLLHGVFSFMGVAGFYRRHRHVETDPAAIRSAHFEFAYRREQAKCAAETLRSHAELTDLGTRFLDTLRDRLLTWCAEPVPADILELAQLANADHHLTWRLRHLVVPAGLAAGLARAWLTGESKPAPSSEEPQLCAEIDRAPASAARLGVIRARVAARSAKEPGEADFALVKGDQGSATAQYLEEIGTGSASTAAWSGLALASGEKTLNHVPELVRAVHREITARSGGAPDPIGLARWLA